MALRIRAPFGALIRAMVALIAVHTLGCSSDPGNSSTETGTPDSDSNVCPKGSTSCGNVDCGSPVDSSPSDTGAADTNETSLPDSGATPETSDDTGSPADSGADTGSDDTGSIDSGSPDSGSSDTGVVTDTGADTTVVDTGTVDSGSDAADSTPSDTGATDTAPPDTGTVTASVLSCTGWTRDTSFDAVKSGGKDLEVAPRIKGFGSNIYIATGGWGSDAAVARKSGGTWTLETLSPPTSNINGMDGASETDLWIATRDLSTAQGRIYHRTSGGWTEDTTEPYAKAFVDVYAPTSSDVFVMGWKSTGYFVWKKTGTTWTAMTLPSVPVGSAFYRLWGLDANHVFLMGSVNTTSGPAQGLLYFYNGSTWSSLTVPTDFVQILNIDGTSMDDLYLVGQTNSGGVYNGLIYHLTTSMGTWTRYADSTVTGYGGVWSPAPGLVLASGSANPDIAGSLRLTKMDKMGAPSTTPVDSKAIGVQSFWVEPDGVTVHFSHIADSGVLAGHYVGTCTKS